MTGDDTSDSSLVPIKRVQGEAPWLPALFTEDEFWRPFQSFVSQFRSFVEALSGNPIVRWRDLGGYMQAEMPLPGLTRNDIDVRVDELRRCVTVTGRTRTKSQDTYIEQSFHHSFPVEHPVRVDQARARLENGLLRVSFPKGPPGSSKSLRIE